jgi:HSP20 family protein
MFFDKEWIESMLELQKKSQELSQGSPWPKDFMDTIIQAIQNSSGNLQGYMSTDYSQTFKDMWNVGATSEVRNTLEPKISITETAKGILVKASLPGIIKSDDISIKIYNNILHISGTISKQGSFSRNIPLPAEVEQQGITANYRDGILTVYLVKAAEAKAQQIDVNFS